MKIETSPKKVWEEYESGRSFNDANNLYDQIEVNENMYAGKQWEGLNAPDLPKPVINVVHPVVAWAIAQVVSDDYGVSLTAMKKNDDIAMMSDALKTETDRVFELTGAKQKKRNIARNAAVHGDCAKYFYFDPEADNGQKVKGEIKTEIIEGRNVYFGNPYSHDVQGQSYILIPQRKLVEEWRDQARANGVKEEQVMRIVADSNDNRQEESDEFDLCTGVIKMWKVDGIVWSEIVTRDVKIRKPFSTGLKLYPIAWFVWEEVADQYHGRSIVTEIVTNQVCVNKLFAMYVRSVEMNAFPKVVYDERTIKSWTNKVGQAIAATPGAGGLNTGKMVEVVRGGDVGPQVMEAINKAIEFIKQSVGVSDAALGNIRPDNASAILVASQQSAVPMELVRRNFKDFVEQEVRIVVDMERNYYGKREVAADSFKTADGELVTDQAGNPVKTVMFDFSTLDSPNMRLNVDVGAAALFSEISRSQTLDNLLLQKIIDPLMYVESQPDHAIPNKQAIIAELKKQKAAQAAMPQQLPQGNTQQTPGGVFQ